MPHQSRDRVTLYAAPDHVTIGNLPRGKWSQVPGIIQGDTLCRQRRPKVTFCVTFADRLLGSAVDLGCRTNGTWCAILYFIMPTTYRAYIYRNEHRTRDYLEPMNFAYTVSRRTKASDAKAVRAFETRLRSCVPHGGTGSNEDPECYAYLEVYGSRGRGTLVRVTGHVTHRRLGRSGHCMVPAGGQWRTSDGKVFASA